MLLPSDAASEQESAFRFSIETKPIEAIIRIHNELISYGRPFILPANKKLLLSSSKDNFFIVLVEKGCFSFCHRRTNLHIGTSFAPAIFGLIDGYSYFHNVKGRPQHYIQAETLCTGWLVPVDIFLQKSDELNLWRDIAKILAQRLMIMCSRDTELTGNDIYCKIKTLLAEIWTYPEEIRKQITVASFIHHRTRVSKSRILGILAELKKGDYIQIESGILMSLSKLPEAF